MKRMVIMAAATLLAGCAVLNTGGGVMSDGRHALLDQYSAADPYMVVNCVYNGWSRLGVNVESTSYAASGVPTVRVYRGVGADHKAQYDPVLEVRPSGSGSELLYVEAHPGTLPRAFEQTVKQCMVPYAGSTD
ncbi:hypothetical protein PATSB16_11390 [Pandoraea thiooxydans]|uniref:Lipoprotein n=1 Tax=Pandoraea thiooxydans TaxID=445709 RepID=A0A0G3EQ81_9BURK|nr:hypothetical protein [Pandoraea thiooxydans]AKJ67447.1 hypothetical protein ABW99_03555 [Pandoraea thiooxydans]APR94481.1 hypothetical protein PATSB16_11390 [Pandoraea thiooxydans]